MKKKILELVVLFFLIFAGVFGFGNLSKVAAANNCKVNINFDINPKSDRFNQPITLSGNINFSGSTFNPPGTTNAGYCNDSDGNPVKLVYIGFANNNNQYSPPAVSLTVPANINSSSLSFSTNFTPSSVGFNPGDSYTVSANVFTTNANFANSSSVTVSFTQGVYATYGCQLSNGLYACSPGGLSDCSDASACQGQKCVQLPDSNACQAIYACVANNGAYACVSTAGDSTCGSATGCASGSQCTQIPLTLCGQTPPPGNQGSTPPPGNQGGATPPGNQGGNPPPGNQATTNSTVNTTNNCTTGSGGSNCLYNPLPTTDLITFILLIMKWLLGVIGIVAVLFIMIGGFKFITAQGNEEAVGAAKKTIQWAIIGLVVAVLSFSMIAIVENILQSNINTTSTTQSGS